jgi:hypothetical protein
MRRDASRLYDLDKNYMLSGPSVETQCVASHMRCVSYALRQMRNGEDAR